MSRRNALKADQAKKRRACIAAARQRIGDERIDDLAELLVETVLGIQDDARFDATMESLKRDLGIQGAADLCVSVAVESGVPV